MPTLWRTSAERVVVGGNSGLQIRNQQVRSSNLLASFIFRPFSAACRWPGPKLSEICPRFFGAPVSGARFRNLHRHDVCRLPLPQVSVQLASGSSQIGFISDIVVIEDCPRLVTGERHAHALGNTGPHHVAYGRAPQTSHKTPLCLNLTSALSTPHIANLRD